MAVNTLEVRNLEVEFFTGHQWERVINDISFDVGKGETVGLVGESGSGKSVTCLAITGLIPSPPGRIVGGSALLDGEDLIKMPKDKLRDLRGDDIGMIFQEPMTSLNPAFTVGEQIAEMVRRHRDVSRKEALDRAVEMLTKVGIPYARRRAKEYPHQFSGGMRQRVMIAMALSCDPKLLIADEPTTALDVTIQAQVLDLLRQMQDEMHMSMIFITHDLGVVAEICDRVIVLYGGRIMEQAGVEDIYHRPSHPYTEGLLASMPQIGPRSGTLASIPGSTPVPSALPSGCPFHTRCPYVEERCTVPPIPLIELPGNRYARCIRTHELALRGTIDELSA